MPEATRRARFGRVTLAMLLALALVGGPRLAVPGLVLAVDCNLLSGPIAKPDPENAGDPLWSIVEDGGQLRVYDPSVYANDTCIQTAITSTELANGLGSFSMQGGDLFFTPPADFYGSATVQYRFTSWAVSNWALVTITVLAVNDKPRFDDSACPATITVAEDSGPYANTCLRDAYPGGVLEDAQSLTPHRTVDDSSLFSAGPAWNLPASGADTPFTFTPKANASGTTTIYFWLTDDGGTTRGGEDTSDQATFTVTITPVDDAPVANNDSYATPFGKQLIVQAGTGLLANDSDIDSPTLTASKVSGPSHGLVSLLPDGSFSYTPQAGYAGPDSFVYRAAAGGKSDDATVGITVLAAGATPPPTSPPSTPTNAPGSGAPTSGDPGASLDPAASPGPTPDQGGASVDPSATGMLSPAPDPSTAPAGAGGTGGGDVPWLLILLIVVLVVVGGNVALYQYLRSRKPG